MRWSLVVVPVALLVPVVACGDSEPAADEPVSTAAMTETQPEPEPAPEPEAAPEPADRLVYVAMGDSAAFNPPAPDGFMWQYAAELEQHFGVEVELRDRTRGAIHSTVMLEQLRTQESLRADLADADVVTLDIPINVWVVPIKTINGVEGRDPADCGGADGEQCLRDALAVYEADTDAIIDEIVAICGDDTLIRLYDIWMIKTGHQIELGTLDVNNPYWKAGMDHVAESAARYGIPVARVYDAFMGPEGTDDPFDAGLLDPDEMHPNAAGARLMTDLVVELGY